MFQKSLTSRYALAKIGLYGVTFAKSSLASTDLRAVKPPSLAQASWISFDSNHFTNASVASLFLVYELTLRPMPPRLVTCLVSPGATAYARLSDCLQPVLSTNAGPKPNQIVAIAVDPLHSASTVS